MDRLTRKQTTITDEVSVSGFGFWSGKDVNLTFTPAPANTGIVFVRTDLPNTPEIPAVVQNRVNGPRRTTLVAYGSPVEMVEHVLAALAGLKIDNCRIQVNRAEMPGCDGSSVAFTDALKKTDIVELEATKKVIEVNSTIRVGDDNAWIQAEPVDTNDLELTYQMEYDCPAIGTQSFTTTLTPSAFLTEVSPARTFVLDTEAELLKQQGLGKRVTYQDVIVFDTNGPIETELRYSNECARHKLLDMVGDFSLSGADIVGKITGHKSGHRLNSQLVFALLQQIVTTKQTRKSA